MEEEDGGSDGKGPSLTSLVLPNDCVFWLHGCHASHHLPGIGESGQSRKLRTGPPAAAAAPSLP